MCHFIVLFIFPFCLDRKKGQKTVMTFPLSIISYLNHVKAGIVVYQTTTLLCMVHPFHPNCWKYIFFSFFVVMLRVSQYNYYDLHGTTNWLASDEKLKLFCVHVRDIVSKSNQRTKVTFTSLFPSQIVIFDIIT